MEREIRIERDRYTDYKSTSVCICECATKCEDKESNKGQKQREGVGHKQRGNT